MRRYPWCMRKKGAPSHGICSKFFSCHLSSWEELHHEEELEASWKWSILSLWGSLRLLPSLLPTKRLLLQWAIPHMMPFFLALEAHNIGRILHLSLTLLLVALVLQRVSGLALGVGVETNPTLVTWGSSHNQHILERGLPFMTPFQVILQRSDLSLELFDFLYMVSINNNTRGSGSFIVRATRQGM